MAHLCVPIMVRSVPQAASQAARAAELGADYVEYRLDEVGPDRLADVSELVSRSALPCIATCRAEEEGGLSDLSPLQRLEVLTVAVAAGARYVDFELACVQKDPHVRNAVFALAGPEAVSKAELGPRAGERCGLILSAHDFFGRPNKLTGIVADMQTLPCDVAKVAWMARTVRDNLEAFELIRLSTKPMIALCMGEAGLMSRVLAGKAGAWLTFAALSAEGNTAPGQVTLADLMDLYGYRQIGPSSKVYGVVGWPVSHSLSPAVHNAAMRGRAHEERGSGGGVAGGAATQGVYLPLPVVPGYESFKATLESLSTDEHLHFSGASITLPHKEDAQHYAEATGARVDPSAHALGTVNTLAFEATASLRASRPTTLGSNWRAANTDATAIVDCLAAALPGGRGGLAGTSVAVIGAGGTGRTAAGALAAVGCEVTLYNRTYERAVAVAGEISGVSPARWEDLTHNRHQIYINCTTVGMYPRSDGNVLAGMDFTPPKGSMALDCVYTPRQTRFLQAFTDAGCVAISGLEMFLHQAARQYEIWHNAAPDLAIMRHAAERELDRREAAH
jgi:3-dehydroquinate dehydratase / shikimate dehydrogenase